MSQPIKLAILGGGTAGWMAANLFAHNWRKDKVQISLIESPDIGIIGVGEGSTPTLKRFFEMLAIPESQWMPKCDATYKINIEFAGWSPQSGVEAYSHPFISQVDTFNERAFTVNCRTRRHGLDTVTSPEKFLLNGLLAKQGKGPLTPESFPFQMEYGYHFDSGKLGIYLSEVAKSKGVEHLQEKVMAVAQHQNGDIKSLHCESGRKIDADFFVDCTGFGGFLIQRTLGAKFKSFNDNLFNDAAVVMPTPIDDTIPVETRATALSAGWCWKIPLTTRFGNGYVYSSQYLDRNSAEQEFRHHIGMLDSDIECRHLSMRVGQLEQHWHRNCLALGLSQGFIEPLEATALHLVQVSIEMFINAWETGQFTNKNIQRYNRDISERFERVRDYIVAHYKLNTRDDSDYWRVNRDNQHLSESLRQILNVWYQRGELDKEIKRQELSSHFNNFSWHCLFSGYGAYPTLAANQPGRGDLYLDQNIERFLNGCSLNFSSHRENLDSLHAN